SLEFFALTFALFKVGAVPVLVDPGMGVRNLGRCLAEAEPEAFIGIPRAHAARLVLGWARRSLQTLVIVGWPWLPGGYSLRQVRARAAMREGEAPAEPGTHARQELRPGQIKSSGNHADLVSSTVMRSVAPLPSPPASGREGQG